MPWRRENITRFQDLEQARQAAACRDTLPPEAVMIIASNRFHFLCPQVCLGLRLGILVNFFEVNFLKRHLLALRCLADCSDTATEVPGGY